MTSHHAPPPGTVYKTYDLAERRVFALITQIGAWPGIICTRDGWRLTYDPLPGVLAEMDSHGYLAGGRP